MPLFQKWLTSDYWIQLLSNIGTGIIKLILAFLFYLIASSIGKRLITRIFNKYKEKKSMTAGRVYTLEKLSVNIFSYALMFIFLVIIFSIIGLPIESLLAGAGVVGLAVGFGAQGLVSDIVTGFFILLEKQMDVGDVVTIGNYSGVVEEVGLRTTQIRGYDGVLNYIPNRQITSISNFSRGNMRALVDIAISNKENVDDVIQMLQRVCREVAANNDKIIEGPNVLGVQSLNTSDMTIRVIAQTKNGEQQEVERQLRKAIKEALDSRQVDH
ncbi:MAG: mechanosensitive ion channel family protein [Tuberibacillus sp.]